MDLSVVIVSWNTRDQLRACLESLDAATRGIDGETFVVDNASGDGTAAMVRERFPGVLLIENRRNAGFARANNQALSLVRGSRVLLLNPDTIVEAEAIRGLMAFLDATPRAGAAGLQLRFPDGRLQNSYDSFPTFGSELVSKHLLRLLFPARYPSKRTVPSGPIPVDIVIGACMILRREVVDALRGFDERYFLFMEEADLCWRIRKAGWRIYHIPGLSIVHDSRASKEQATAHAYIEYARSTYLFYPRCVGRVSGRLLRALKTLKVIAVNPILSLGACTFTLGRVPRHVRRLAIRSHLCAWHLLGCPASWGMREVSPFRDFERERAEGRETLFRRDAGPGLLKLARTLSGDPEGGFAVERMTGRADFEVRDPDAVGFLRIAVFRPKGLAARLSRIAVPDGVRLLERAEEVADRGIPVVRPVAAGAFCGRGVLRGSFAVFREGAAASTPFASGRTWPRAASRPGSFPWIPIEEAFRPGAADLGERLEAAGRFLRRLHDGGIDIGPSAAAVSFRASAPLDSGEGLAITDPRSLVLGRPLDLPARAASLRTLDRRWAALGRLPRLRFLAGYRGKGKERLEFRGQPAKLLPQTPEFRGQTPESAGARPIRVLHLCSIHKVTGPAETALDTARALARIPGIRTEFAAGIGPSGENGLGSLALERGAATAELGLRLSKHFSPARALLDARRLRRAIRDDPPDIIHCHLPGDHIVAALGAPPSIPIVRTLYDADAPRRTWRIRRTLERRADRIVCFSSAVAEALARAPSWIPRKAIARLDPPIDIERFDPARPLADRRKELGVPPEAFAVGIAARLQTHRRFEILFEAISIAHREVDIRLVVIGRGTHAEEVAREPVRRLGLHGTVRLAGYLSGDDYVATLKALDAAIFLVPGSDGTCRAVREFLAMGLPVIAVRRGMLGELVRDGRTGILVQDTPGAIAMAIVSLARDRERRERMARAARADAAKRFSYADHAAALAAIYRSLVSDTGRKS
jgi:GT2 family glycosyltransferase/glycosyltransferase involved in cell wall biosynthesis